MESFRDTMIASSRMEGNGTTFMIYSLLIQSWLATIHKASWCGCTAGAGVRLFGGDAPLSAHKLGKFLTKPVTKWTIGGRTTPVPLGLKSIPPSRRQPARGMLNALVNISLGIVAMFSGQRMSCQTAGSTSQATSTLHSVTASLINWHTTVRVGLRRTYTALPTTCLPRMKSTNISSLGSIRWVWRRTMTTCWRKKTPLCVSQAWTTGMASRSSWLACQIIRLSGSWNLHTLEDIRWKDSHQHPIRCWSRAIITSMKWLVWQPAYAVHFCYAPPHSFDSDMPLQRLNSEIHTADWWLETQLRMDTWGL